MFKPVLTVERHFRGEENVEYTDHGIMSRSTFLRWKEELKWSEGGSAHLRLGWEKGVWGSLQK